MSVPVTSGLVAEYQFNEGTGATVHDSTTNAFNMTFSGSNPWNAQGLGFNGGGGAGLVSAALQSLMTSGTGLTVQVVTMLNPITRPEFIVYANGSFDIVVGYNGGDDIEADITTSAGSKGSGDTKTFVDGSNTGWILAESVWDGSRISVYTNNDTGVSAAIAGTLKAASNNGLYVGANGNTGNDGGTMSGTVSYLVVYNRALSAEERQQNQSYFQQVMWSRGNTSLMGYSGGGPAIVSSGALSLSGQSLLSVTGQVVNVGPNIVSSGPLSLSGASTLTVTGQTVTVGSASLSGESMLAVTGQVAGPGVVSGSATLVGESTLAVSGVVVIPQTVTLGGESTLSASGITVQPQSVSLSGESTLAVTGRVVASTAITLSGESTLSVNGQTVTVGSVELTGESALTVNGQVVSTNKITMTGESSLSVRGITVVVGSVSMSGESTLTIYTAVPLQELVTLQGEWIKDVTLQGEFATTVTLEGEFVTTVILQGGVGVTKENQDFEFYAGESRTVSIPISGEDFSASTLTFTMKDPYGKVVTFTNPVTVTGDSSGNVTFKLTKDQTATLTTGNYRFKVEAEDQQNNDGVLTVGTIQVKSF